MTPERLREIVKALGAVWVDGDLLAACPLHQPECTEPDRYKLVLTPGNQFAVVVCCRVCGWEDRKWWGRFWGAVGVQWKELRVGSREESEGLWEAAGYGTGNRTANKPLVRGELYLGEQLPDEQLHEVYTDLLQSLPLTDRHRKWLDKKGLPNGYELGYRSGVGESVRRELGELLRSKWGNLLQSVPGFGDGKVNLRDACILHPIRNAAGQLTGVKQRITDGGRARMRLLAGGPRNRVRCHCPLGVGSAVRERVWVTEGERKADVHWGLTGLPTIGVPGVGTVRTAPPLLHALGTRAVVVALDRDEAGVKGTDRLCGLLHGEGYSIEVAEWGDFKGLDDAVVGKGVVTTRPRVHPAPKAYSDTQPHTPTDTVLGLHARVRDAQLIPYLRHHGPQLRDSIQCYQVLLSQLIASGEVVMRKSVVGQVVGLRGDEERVANKVREVNGGR